MKVQRVKNASRNVVFGVLLRFYQVLGPLVLRTAMIYILGMEYVGLNSLFTSILQVLNLTELGVGTAMVFSMYKPIAEDDEVKICALMQLYKLYYRIIGCIIAAVGLLITPVIPKLIDQNTTIPLNVTYLYWMNLGYTVLSYWLFAYKSSILQAHQRIDIISKVTIVTNTVMYALQFGFLVITKNYYYFMLAMIIGQVLTNVLTAIVADRYYPMYKPKGKLNRSEIKEINQRVKDLFTAKVGGVVQNSSDSIIISAFLGLTILGQYNNYYYVLNAIFGFIIIFFNACLAGVGNSIILETEDKNYADFKKIALIAEWIAGVSACCLLCLYQPFISIWAGQENMLPFGIVICLSCYLYVITTNQMLCLYKDAGGIWHEDRFRPLVTALANLIMNIVFVKSLGLYGVVLSTVISMVVIGIPWLISNLFRTVFHRSPLETMKQLGIYFLISAIACAISYAICTMLNPINTVLCLFLRLLICLIIPNVIFFIFYRKLPEFSQVIQMLDRSFGGKLRYIPFINKYIK